MGAEPTPVVGAVGRIPANPAPLLNGNRLPPIPVVGAVDGGRVLDVGTPVVGIPVVGTPEFERPVVGSPGVGIPVVGTPAVGFRREPPPLFVKLSGMPSLGHDRSADASSGSPSSSANSSSASACSSSSGERRFSKRDSCDSLGSPMRSSC